MKKKIAIIGSGFSGLSAAAYCAKEGFEVHVFEQHDQPGGRARQFTTPSGFTFDMGPSWYWMPDIIEDFFNDFGHKSSDFFQLIALNPQFEMIFEDEKLAIPQSFTELKALFETLEIGAGAQLEQFMHSAQYKYEVGMREFVNKPCHNWTEFIALKTLKSALQLDLLTNFRSYVARYFTHPKLRTLMEFPVIFLGASPKNIPALYSLMNYGGYVLGTHYPMGGFYQLVLAMQQVAQQQGAQFHFNQTIDKIRVNDGAVSSLVINGQTQYFDTVIASSDYHHTESLLEPKYRNYDENYWKSKTFAPSSLIYYLGFSEKIPNLKHHTLFFENELDQHIEAIYEDKKWPEKPLFYVCCPSKTDPSVAPQSGENLFLLLPLAISIEDAEAVREKYLHQMLARIEKQTQTENLAAKIVFKRSYCVSDFVHDYNAYGGNAYGLANTLSQTAVLKPKIKNKKVRNLYYTGQLTVPGPGVPPSIISGKIVAQEVTQTKSKKP
jgi:phytoene desaturase